MNSRILAVAVAASFLPVISYGQVATKPSPSTPVQVVNDSTTPVPVTGNVSVAGTSNVNVTNGSLPVTQSGTWNVGISGTPSVNVVGGSVNVGTKIVASFEADNVDSQQHTFGPYDISPYSKIRFTVVANGNGSVIADIETDGLGDYFTVDAGNSNTRVYEVAGTKATIVLQGDSSITQVFVRLFGS